MATSYIAADTTWLRSRPSPLTAAVPGASPPFSPDPRVESRRCRDLVHLRPLAHRDGRRWIFPHRSGHRDRGGARFLAKHAPDRIVRRSHFADQGMHWSPNGRWIVYRSHAGGTDDIYLVPARDTSSPRLVSAAGLETGWPRWSPDGRWIVFPNYTRDASGARRSSLYVIPVDQETGETLPQRTVDMGYFRHDALQAEWTPDSERLVFEAAEGAGRKALYVVAREGGTPERLHEWATDQVHSGISVSPDGEWSLTSLPTVRVVPGAPGAPGAGESRCNSQSTRRGSRSLRTTRRVRGWRIPCSATRCDSGGWGRLSSPSPHPPHHLPPP